MNVTSYKYDKNYHDLQLNQFIDFRICHIQSI